MKVPVFWLKQYVKTKDTTGSIAKVLTSIGHMQDGPIKKVEGEEVIDLEIRQNRPDCLSILGIAREVAAASGARLTYPDIIKDTLFRPKGDWNIKIEDSALCYRFNSIEIENVKVGKSPDWLKKALKTYGMESINNVVDITNYVMIELGQPLHAFDKDKVDKNIVIRTAKNKEKFTALGDKQILLTNADLVIADSKQILALAGVIGSNTSGVQLDTTNIIIEAATYNQASIRRTSLRHAIRTEASTRLEKFLHPQNFNCSL